MRFRRKRTQDSGVELIEPESEVRIVPLGDPDATGEIDDDFSGVLDELSDAFGRDVDEDDGDGDVLTARDGSARTTIGIDSVDDLPDAMYLDDVFTEEVGGDSSGTVFIEDDGRSDPVEASGASRPTADPRMRQRRIGVRRAQNRRRLVWVGAAVLVVVALIAALALLGSSWFAVDDVDVTGRRNADEAAVQEIVDDLVGTPVLRVDTDDYERRLEALPWVADARVRTDFPNSATVELREREPVATMRGADERFRILDREGRVLTVIDGQAAALVLISGPGTLDLEPGSFAEVGPAAAASLVTKLTPRVRSRLISMSATADGSDLQLLLGSTGPDGEPGPEISVRLGEAVNDSDQIEKLVRLERVLDDSDGAGVTTIDVSTAEATQR